MQKTIASLLAIATLAIAFPAAAATRVIVTSSNTGSVTNTVSVIANTGGNTATPGGSITTGSASASVILKVFKNRTICIPRRVCR